MDFALRHSLVQALQGAGIERLFVTDWRPATPQMRFWCVDDYIAALNVVVDELGGGVSLIGLCQAVWMALMYAARFPDKIHKLVLAGAPIDVAADASKLTELANNTPSAIFKESSKLGEGRLQGQHLLKLLGADIRRRRRVHRALQSPEPMNSTGFRRVSLLVSANGTRGPWTSRERTTCKWWSSCSRRTDWRDRSLLHWAAGSICPRCVVRCSCSPAAKERHRRP